jgi:hypothetical protein
MPANHAAGKVDGVDLLWVVGDGDRVAPLIPGWAGATAAAAERNAALGKRAVPLVTDDGVAVKERRTSSEARNGPWETSSITAVAVTARSANAARLANRQAASPSRSSPIISRMRRRRGRHLARSAPRLLAMSVLV